MPAAIAPIRPLAWELPYAAPVALKKKKFRLKGRRVADAAMLHQAMEIGNATV